MAVAALDLWEDWCAVADLDPGARDEETLARFEGQCAPSRRLMNQLTSKPRVKIPRAWPSAPEADLNQVLRNGDAILRMSDGTWVHRLRVHRLLFVAVLLAPERQGGLSLTRDRALSMTATWLNENQDRIGTAADEAACPRCAVWSWLEVIGTRYGWQHSSVRALGHRRDSPSEPGALHRHERADPEPEWLLSPAMLPRIDRWGYIEGYCSMHRSSLSNIVEAIRLLAGESPQEMPKVPVPQDIRVRSEPLSRSEADAIMDRADELNARVARLLQEFDAC